MRGIDCPSCAAPTAFTHLLRLARHARRSADGFLPLVGYGIRQSWRGPLPQLAGEGGAIGRRKTPVFRRAMAPDGVWPTASAQAGLRDRHREPSSEPSLAFRTSSGLRPPSPLRGEGKTVACILLRESRNFAMVQNMRKDHATAVSTSSRAAVGNSRENNDRRFFFCPEVAHNPLKSLISDERIQGIPSFSNHPKPRFLRSCAARPRSPEEIQISGWLPPPLWGRIE